jgi:Zn ribbon nucleic-acid-binding protein
MKVKICPKCEGEEVILVAGGTVGMFECKACGFQSSIFPEKEMEVEENGA